MPRCSNRVTGRHDGRSITPPVQRSGPRRTPVASASRSRRRRWPGATCHRRAAAATIGRRHRHGSVGGCVGDASATDRERRSGSLPSDRRGMRGEELDDVALDDTHVAQARGSRPPRAPRRSRRVHVDADHALVRAAPRPVRSAPRRHRIRCRARHHRSLRTGRIEHVLERQLVALDGDSPPSPSPVRTRRFATAKGRDGAA